MTAQHHLSTLTDLGHKLSEAGSTRHVFLNGSSLKAAQLIAISKPGTTISILKDEGMIARMEDSVRVLHNALSKGEGVYGVNTGFGGSADTRTDKPHQLQHSLLHLLHVGISSPLSENNQEDLVPEPFVRAAMAIRVNSVIRGHSAVSQPLVASLVNFLNRNIVPCVPLRGSISASGDLIPLAHIVSCLVGAKDAYVFYGSGSKRRILPASEALQIEHLAPLEMQPKEGLALLNGTSMSCAYQTLQLFETAKQAFAAQVLTAMTVEALTGSTSPYEPFVSDVCRPHPGQCDAAATIRVLLRGSRLVKGPDHKPSMADVGLLAQDRYSVRTTPQWFGPLLEQLWLAQSQMDIELNSTTDNPLVGGKEHGDRIFNGGNFQASAVATAAETTRLSLASFARASFAQISELINADLNNGLPANLAGGEPSRDYGCKGLEIASAGYMSEIAFLANPVTSHVQTAELQNQALNSLALISSRYTHEASKVLFMLMANHVYVLCQAITLRVAFSSFAEGLHERFATASSLFSGLSEACQATFVKSIISATARAWNLDSPTRFAHAFDKAIGPTLSSAVNEEGETYKILQASKIQLQEAYAKFWTQTLDLYASSPRLSASHLGATEAMFNFVRIDLGVPFNRGGDQEHEISHYVSLIYDALRQDTVWARIHDRIRASLNESDNKFGQMAQASSALLPSSPPHSRAGSKTGSLSSSQS